MLRRSGPGSWLQPEWEQRGPLPCWFGLTQSHAAHALGFLVPDNGPDKCLTPSLVPDLSLTGWETPAHVR